MTDSGVSLLAASFYRLSGNFWLALVLLTADVHTSLHGLCHVFIAADPDTPAKQSKPINPLADNRWPAQTFGFGLFLPKVWQICPETIPWLPPPDHSWPGWSLSGGNVPCTSNEPNPPPLPQQHHTFGTVPTMWIWEAEIYWRVFGACLTASPSKSWVILKRGRCFFFFFNGRLLKRKPCKESPSAAETGLVSRWPVFILYIIWACTRRGDLLPWHRGNALKWIAVSAWQSKGDWINVCNLFNCKKLQVVTRRSQRWSHTVGCTSRTSKLSRAWQRRGNGMPTSAEISYVI